MHAHPPTNPPIKPSSNLVSVSYFQNFEAIGINFNILFVQYSLIIYIYITLDAFVLWTFYLLKCNLVCKGFMVDVN